MSSGGQLPYRLPTKRQVSIVPTTRLGKWAVGLAIASVVLANGWTLMGPLGGFPGLVVGILGGTVALVAIVGRHERALAVYAALLPFLGAVTFVLFELLGLA